ncbi:MAG: TetR/AcrR family transcriptional regulator [Anaeromyxobacteraceae bacterium]|nr:TetR/AcrR family transcriptional regulator [Anaeromyxobacteraceae bacterium]
MKRARAGRAASPSTAEGLVRSAVKLIRGAHKAEDVTVRRVTRAAGANLNAVNYHFGSKEVLVREAVRAIIRDWFRAQGLGPDGVGDAGLGPVAALACGFLFAEPVAARLALDAEVAEGGGGPSLTRETLDGLASQLAAARPDLPPGAVRLRVWLLLSALHQVFLRPAGCREWLGVEPHDASARAALLDELVALVEA